MKAFQTVKMTPENAEKDPILAGAGKNDPRVLVVDPVKEKVRALEKGRLKASTLYREMEHVADRFYEGRLKKHVDEHLDLLTKRDQLANEVKTLQGKVTRLEEKGEKAEKDVAKLKTEIEGVQKKLAQLDKDEQEIWKLERKKQPA